MLNYNYGKAAKLPSDQENPIDQVFISLADVVSPIIKNFGATPNMITTACVIVSILAARSVYMSNKKMFVLWALLAYFLDCLDGHYARKYDMCTLFGDYYDHITDWIYYAMMFYAAFYVRGLKVQYRSYGLIIYGVIATAVMGMMWHFGCQEAVYSKSTRMNNTQSPTLGVFNRIFSYPYPEKIIQTSKWVGSGTYTILIIAIIYFMVR